ncbi:FlgN-like domain protein [Reinekea forsetii]|jgi:flagellar biosynthesis/type III secretory pathway chaperone|uniref:FlgN-like domain protein n=2 Tax=Reinekea forsetii TaxID=1336806 RepID=A0A2K8KRC5_9GAMM|nr:FlgN-like domain protein [Reinekea forsetii]
MIMAARQLIQFQETLSATNATAQEFGVLLMDERKHLTSTLREDVNLLLPQKELLIKQLAGLQSSILQFCTASEIEPTYGALRAYLYRLGIAEAETVLDHWTALKNTLIKNQALNKTNEAILKELLRRNQIKQAMVSSLGRQSDTYAAPGKQTSRTMEGWVAQV